MGHDYRTLWKRIHGKDPVRHDDVRHCSTPEHSPYAKSSNVCNANFTHWNSFIDTENTFSALRQDELLKKTKNQYALLDNIFVWKVPSIELFLQLLDSLPLFLSSHPNVSLFISRNPQVRLVVIDSIAYHFRQFTDMIERSVKLSAAIRVLTSLASQHTLSILVTNHITSFTPDSESPLNTTQIIQPLLGPVWWHAVTNQLLLTMSVEGRRELRVQKSSYLPPVQTLFKSERSLLVLTCSYKRWNCPLWMECLLQKDAHHVFFSHCRFLTP